MEKQNLIQKVVAALSKMVNGAELIKEIKAFKLGLSEQELADKAAADKAAADKAEADKKAGIKMMSDKTKDGLKVISYDATKLDVNVPVVITNADGTPAETEGEFTLENGNIIKVVGGVVVEIKPADPAGNEMPIAMKAMFAEQKAEVENKFTALTKEVEKLTAENKELTKITSTLLEFNKKLLEIPIEEVVNLSSEDLEKLTPLQKRRYQKENAKV